MAERYYFPGTKPKGKKGCCPSDYADKANCEAMKGWTGKTSKPEKVVSSQIGDQYNKIAMKGSGAQNNN